MAQQPTSLIEIAPIGVDGRAAALGAPDIILEQSRQIAHACDIAVLRIHPDKAASRRQLALGYEPYFRKPDYLVDQLACAS